jgi:hypothetical protein
MKDKIKQWWELSFDSFTGNGIYPKTYTHPISYIYNATRLF